MKMRSMDASLAVPLVSSHQSASTRPIEAPSMARRVKLAFAQSQGSRTHGAKHRLKKAG